VENFDHGKNFQKAPTGEHSSHLAQGAGGLITYSKNGEAQERSKGTMMISASRSTIQDPETLKNVFLPKTMTSMEKDEILNFQSSSLNSCSAPFVPFTFDISEK
jgi:hypothetical protein